MRTQALHNRVIIALAGAQLPVDAPDIDGVTPLMLAARYGLVDVVACLLRLGADVNSCDVGQCTPLHYSYAFGQLDVATYLEETAGANRDATSESDDRPVDVKGKGLALQSAPTEDVLFVRPQPRFAVEPPC